MACRPQRTAAVTLDAPIHDPLMKLNLEAIAGTYQ